MTNTKWLRSALLGGVAVSVMATGAQASELSDLKAQLEALQSRVNTIESAPAANLPAGASYMTLTRGQHGNERLNEMGNSRVEDNYPSNRGYTIAVTPTADLPAPTTTITISGVVYAYALWNNEDVSTFDVDGARDGTSSNIDLFGRGRFRIRSSTDTAIGQIRTLIEVQATNGGNVVQRHALGEWDMTENWTFQAGRTWSTSGPLDYGVTVVPGTATGGPDIRRTEMFRLRYRSGPIQVMFAVENPTDPVGANNADYPNIAGHIRYNAAGGHQFWAGAEVADYGTKAGYYLNGGANISLGDIATLTTTATYGKGVPLLNFGQVNGTTFDKNGNPTKALGAGIGVSVAASETTTINAIYGFAKLYKQAAGRTKTSHTVHANVLWRPVQQMRLGWEVRWGKENEFLGNKNDVFGAAFGAWFFF